MPKYRGHIQFFEVGDTEHSYGEIELLVTAETEEEAKASARKEAENHYLSDRRIDHIIHVESLELLEEDEEDTAETVSA